jgi:hypothetical protein
VTKYLFFKRTFVKRVSQGQFLEAIQFRRNGTTRNDDYLDTTLPIVLENLFYSNFLALEIAIIVERTKPGQCHLAITEENLNREQIN